MAPSRRLRCPIVCVALIILWTAQCSCLSESVTASVTRAVLGVDHCGSFPNEECSQAVRSLFQEVESLYEQKEVDVSHRLITLCRRVFGLDPEIELGLAQLLCRVGDFHHALPAFDSARRKSDDLCGRSSCWDNRVGVFQLVVAGRVSHGMCLMQARKFSAAADQFRDALRLDATLDAVAWHLGLACDYGQDWKGAVDAYVHWLEIQKQNDKPRVLPPRPPGKLVVAIFCLSRVEGMPHGWGPSALSQSGIGGSEEAVILLSRELAALGMHVEVYADPPDREIGADKHGVVWVPVHLFDPKRHPPHVFVSWRGYALSTLGGPSALNLLWLHDRVIAQLLSPAMLPDLGGILVLSRHHAVQLPPHAQYKAIPTRNGLEPSFFRDGPNRHSDFIFASHPERGLEQLLQAWPLIRRDVPGAVLRVFHGFPAGYGEGGAPPEELQRMRSLQERVTALLAQPGVEVRGMVNQSALADAYAQAGFWLYPTSMAETSCISAMKAMANGAVPVTSRFSPSGLTETTAAFDLGPHPPAPGVTLASSPEQLQRWAEAVAAAAQGGARVWKLRAEMKAWARARYSWRGVAEEWTALFRDKLHPETRHLVPDRVSPSDSRA